MKLLLIILIIISYVNCVCDYWKDGPKCSPTAENSNGPFTYKRDIKFNEKCCEIGNKNKLNEIKKCANFRYSKSEKSTEMVRCFGASGADCFGIKPLVKQATTIKKIGKKLGWNKLKKLGESVLIMDEGKGWIKVPTSVGSIYHDSCCLTYPNGFFCNEYSRPYLSFLKKRQNECPCALEWRKAVLSLATGRWWYTQYKGNTKDPFSVPKSNLEPTGKKLPPTRLPTSLGKFGKLSNYHLMEVKATSKLRAPPGTKLDCPGVDPRCRTGFLRFNREIDDHKAEPFVIARVKKAEVTSSTSSTYLEENSFTKNKRIRDKVKRVGKRIKRAGRSLVSKVKSIFHKLRKMEVVDHQDKGGIVAGDSVYCESGKFKSVHFRLKLVPYFRRYGICA